MKKLLPLFLAFVLLFAACGASGQSNQDANTLHNARLGFDISLGMSKDKIDELLGEPLESDAIYSYVGSGFAAMYKEGKAVMLIATDYQWASIGGIRVTDPAENITTALGEPATAGQYIYLFDKKSKPTSEKDDAVVFAVYGVANEEINSITLVPNG